MASNGSNNLDRRSSVSSVHSAGSTSSSSILGDAGHESRRRRASRASLQDRVFTRLLSRISEGEIPEEEVEELEEIEEEIPKEETKSRRPGFSLPKINLNLIELNQRLGAVFEGQERIHELFTWVRPVHTLCLLSMWILICLNPHLLPVLPLLAQLYLIMMPAFLARHPAAKNDPRQQPINFGPPTEPPPNIKAVAVASRDFVRNMRDLQHSMEAMNKAHDALETYVIPQFNFSDESRTTEIFVATFGLTAFAFMTIHTIPWATILLFGGSIGIIAGHPAVKELLLPEDNPSSSRQRVQRVKDLLQKLKDFIEDDCVLDEQAPIRQVEVFELQRHRAATNEWEPWLFSPTPYDPLSPARIAGARATGTQFFEEVMAPAAWRWKDKKWHLDRSSTEWVQQRMITGVEVETTGEMWVYDIPPEDEKEYMSAVVASTSSEGKDRGKTIAKSGWEEASGIEKRGEWRRRRWTRDVERKSMRD